MDALVYGPLTLGLGQVGAPCPARGLPFIQAENYASFDCVHENRPIKKLPKENPQIMKALTCSALAAFIMLTTAQGQSGPVSSIPVDDLKFDPQLAYGVLTRLAKKYHVVIGVSGKNILRDRNPVLVNIALKHGTLSQVFDAVIAADPSYSWRTTASGSVHFVVGDPLPLVDVGVRIFDRVKPSRFDRGGVDQIPEVSAWLQKNNCVMPIMEVVVGGRPEEWQPFEIHAKGVPLWAVLDELANRSGGYFWSLIQHSDEPCQMGVQF